MSKQDRLDGFYWHLNSKMNTRSYETLKTLSLRANSLDQTLTHQQLSGPAKTRSKRQSLNNQQNVIGENGLKSSNCAWITAILLGSSSTSAVLSYIKPAIFHSYWCCHPFFRVALPAVLPALALATVSSVQPISVQQKQTVDVDVDVDVDVVMATGGITKGATYWHYLTLIFHWWLT